MKTKNKKQTVFRFPFFYENEKRLKALKIQNKNLLNMEMVVNYLNFFFLTEVKTKYKYRTLNFVFQFTKKTKWYFGYTDCLQYYCLLHYFSREEREMLKKLWLDSGLDLELGDLIEAEE